MRNVRIRSWVAVEKWRRLLFRSALFGWFAVAAMHVVGASWMSLAVVGALIFTGVYGYWTVFGFILIFSVLHLLRWRHLPAIEGRLLWPADDPELVAFVRAVAARVGFSAPLTVRVLPVPDAALAPSRVGGHRGFVLGLGWPFLRLLPPDQLAAVIAHELAHHQHISLRRTELMLRGRGRLVEAMSGRFFRPSFLARPLLAATQPTAWAQEFAADADAAAAVGTQSCADALEHTELILMAFDNFGEGWYAELENRDSYPVDFFPALADALADPLVRSSIVEELASEIDSEDDPSNSHPAKAVRIAALPECPPWPDLPSLSGPVRQVAALDAWAASELSGELPDSELQPVQMLDLDPEIFAPHVVERCADLARATHEVTGHQELAASLAALGDPSQWRAIAALLVGEPANTDAFHERDAVAVCVATAVTASLLEAGWPRASRWLHGFRRSPDGTVVDIRSVTYQALDTSDPTRLLELLASAGVSGDPGPMR